MSEHEIPQKLPPQTPPSNTALTVPDLRRQLTRLTAAQRAEMGMDLSAHESAQEKLQRIAMLTEHLAHSAGNITVELAHHNPEAFAEALREVHNIMSSIEIELITFDSAVETQYPKTSFIQKCVVALVMVVRGMKESTFMETLGNNDRTRATLFDARKALTALMEKHQTAIKKTRDALTDEKEEPVRQRQQELLLRSAPYQKLLSEKRQADGDLIAAEKDPGPVWSEHVHITHTGLNELGKRYNVPVATLGSLSSSDHTQCKQRIVNAITGKLSKLNAEIAAMEEAALGVAQRERRERQSSGL